MLTYVLKLYKVLLNNKQNCKLAIIVCTIRNTNGGCRMGKTGQDLITVTFLDKSFCFHRTDSPARISTLPATIAHPSLFTLAWLLFLKQVYKKINIILASDF